METISVTQRPLLVSRLKNVSIGTCTFIFMVCLGDKDDDNGKKKKRKIKARLFANAIINNV